MRLLPFSLVVCALLAGLLAPAVQADDLRVEETTQSLTQCLAHWATQLEPLQDNMLDLAEMVFSAACHTERDAMLEASGALNAPDALAVYRKNWLHSVQAMVLVARAERLGVELTIAP
ncbi:hypothetical protein [Tabrizicola thermarum]|uniref:hypothetical protein n=1 Tax=Tabrizicola thermarum TaxID=2670345 RepID=UPI000FFB1257|nr:hypothetical protein [Tabrizicola thermarum]